MHNPEKRLVSITYTDKGSDQINTYTTRLCGQLSFLADNPDITVKNTFCHPPSRTAYEPVAFMIDYKI